MLNVMSMFVYQCVFMLTYSSGLYVSTLLDFWSACATYYYEHSWGWCVHCYLV
jgi:hypothetical protein